MSTCEKSAEIKYNRLGWRSGKVLVFKTIGRGSGPATALSFSFIRRHLIQPSEGDRLLSGVLHQPMNSRLNRRI